MEVVEERTGGGLMSPLREHGHGSVHKPIQPHLRPALVVTSIGPGSGGDESTGAHSAVITGDKEEIGDGSGNDDTDQYEPFELVSQSTGPGLDMASIKPPGLMVDTAGAMRFAGVVPQAVSRQGVGLVVAAGSGG